MPYDNRYNQPRHGSAARRDGSYPDSRNRGSNAPRHNRRPQQPPRRAFPRVLVIAACAAALALVAVGAVLVVRSMDKGEVEPTPFATALTASVTAIASETGSKVAALAPVYAEIGRETTAIISQGYQVGYYLGTVEGKTLWSFNADTTFYGASSIKGPFVISSAGDDAIDVTTSTGLVTATIVNSDNSSYYALRDAWGTAELDSWLSEVGAKTASSFAYYSPRQLSELWIKCWDILKEDNDETKLLDDVFSRPDNSTFPSLGASETWSKPGWIADSVSSTVDAGLIQVGQQTYVLAVMTSKGEDFSVVSPLVKSLYQLVVAQTA